MTIPRRRGTAQQRTRNMMLSGGGAGTTQDRGALQSAAQVTSNPYYSNNFFYRWQEYTRWYMTAWEAQKLINIPVEDALRKPFELVGVDDEVCQALMRGYDKFNLEQQNRRALIQERLLGGCVQPVILKRPQGEDLSTPLDLATIEKGDLLAINVADISRITRPNYTTDPLSPDYDRAETYMIQGVEVHESRMVVFDGAPLINRAAMNILQNFRYNPAGFGESRLASVYDLLVRMVGTQQAAYHLVNMASVLLVKYDNLFSLEAMRSRSEENLEEIVRQVSLYRGAVIEGKGADVTQHSASFGSVPELVMSFAQLVSAAGDIPATRFLGTAPGGLNATGDADLQNYYNTIDSYQRLRITPAVRKQLAFIACDLYGAEQWRNIERDLEISFPPLWNLSARDIAETDRTYADTLRVMYESGLLGRDSVLTELTKRDFFKSSTDAQDFIDDGTPLADPDTFMDATGAQGIIDQLAAGGKADGQ